MLQAVRSHRPMLPHGAGVKNYIAVVNGLLLLLYLLVGTTLGFSRLNSWHDEQRVVQLIVVTWFCAAFLYLGMARTQAPVRWPTLLLILVFFLGLVSAIRSAHVTAGLADLGLWLSMFTLALSVSASVTSNVNLWTRWLPRMVLLLSAAHVIAILARYGAAVELRRPLDVSVLLLGYANPRFPSALYALLMPFLAALALKPNERGYLRAGARASLSFLWCVNFALETRAVVFAYVATISALVPLLGWQVTRPLLVLLLKSALTGLGLYIALFLVLPHFFAESALIGRTDSLLSANGRQFLLMSSWQAIRQSPWLGIGPMGFAAIPHVWAAHPHNWVLQIAAEYGLPAVILLTFSTLGFMLQRASWIRATPLGSGTLQTVSIPAYTAVLIGLVYGLVDGNLVMPVSQTAFFIALGVLLGSVKAVEAGQMAGLRIHIHSALVAVAVAAGVIAMNAFALQTFGARQADRWLYHQIYVADRFFVPRFWEQGLLLEGPKDLSD